MYEVPNVDRHAWAVDAYAWLTAYQDAGFTESQAMELLVASLSRPVFPQSSPENAEFLSRMTALVNQALVDN